jgi:signal transduction histidine kinase
VAALPLLAQQVRSAGIPVELELASDLANALSPAAELCVYRIVKEALTNVVKHAGPASARVVLHDEEDALVLEVVDDGLATGSLPAYPLPARPSASVHHGIVGMRERVALFDGSFAAGPRPGGGFLVNARFPAERVRAA